MYISHVFLRSIALFPANAGKSKGASIALAMLEVVKNIPAYAAIVERAIHRDEMSFTAVEVAAHWHEHFRNVASPSERVLNDQAVCFFQVAQGPGLGTLILGRKGAPTRFEFSDEGKNKFADIAPMTSGLLAPADTVDEEDDGANDGAVFTPPASTPAAGAFNNKVFITHGKNIKVLNQIKEIVSYGNYQPIIAQEHETIAKPVPDKVMDDMRACSAAVIHVSSEATYKDANGKERAKINDNVLIEIGAAMALYKRNFILVVEDGLELPSNLQGLLPVPLQRRRAGDGSHHETPEGLQGIQGVTAKFGREVEVEEVMGRRRSTLVSSVTKPPKPKKARRVWVSGRVGGLRYGRSFSPWGAFFMMIVSLFTGRKGCTEPTSQPSCSSPALSWPDSGLAGGGGGVAPGRGE